MLTPHDFLGTWIVARAVEDRLGGDARFDGTATFAAEGDGLGYREEGTLRLAGGAAFAAHRGYLWRWDDTGVAVLFPDGRFFHRFVPAGRGAGTDHPCGADLYRVAYDFAAWPSWSSTWEVRGPRKDYRLRSDYRRPAVPLAPRAEFAAEACPRAGSKGGRGWPET